MINLPGPRKERTYEAARAGIPMDADEVRWCIDQLERDTKNKNARIRLAELAINIGNITADGKAVYADYLKQVTA